MKQCNYCNQQKELSEFSKDKTRKDSLNCICKLCKKILNKQYYLDNLEYFKQQHLQQKQSHIIVYLLPDHNYVGITDNPYHRMIQHRSEYNRHTDNWIEIARYNDRRLALQHEALLHAQGYEGARAI